MKVNAPQYTRPFLVGGCILLLSATLMLPGPASQTGNFFTAADKNGDGLISKDEFRAATASWMAGRPSIGQDQLAGALDKAFPASVIESMLASPGPQNQTPKAEDVEKMMAALPSEAAVKPLRPRKILVLSKAAGFVHSCIPLAARTLQEMGTKTGAWSTTVTYDPADINASNLKQYDLVFLNNTTGQFLDDSDAAMTAARKKALLEFVRSGKGLAGIHAAGDAYHAAAPNAPGLGPVLAPMIISGAHARGDKTLTSDELAGFSDQLFAKVDAKSSGEVSVPELRSRLLFAIFSSGGEGGFVPPANGRQGRDPQHGTWPDFNAMIGGYFKYHWLDPTHIVYRIDDPKSPVTAMFTGPSFALDDETYTFSANSWSRKNVHVLTSIDYAQMSEADKKKEDYPRPDHDYGLSWIRRESKGRVFYEAHGHDEKIYANKVLLQHLLAGTQYALGDLKASDSPSR